MSRLLAAVSVLGMLLVGIRAGPSAAQVLSINFPYTPVGATSSVRCPANGARLCFGSNCSSAGTVQGVSGPNRPFRIAKFNLVSVGQFTTGACEANPTGLPVAVGANQVLAYEASFAPTAVGSFSGSATFATPQGPVTVNFTGSSQPPRTDKGLIAVQLGSDGVVPGNLLNIQYQTKKNTLQGNVDIYFAIGVPWGQLLFLNEQGALTAAFQPLLRNVSVTDATQTLYSGPFPIDVPFGTYTFYMVMLYAGVTLDANNLPATLASGLSQATLNYTPLSAAQQALLTARGRPDHLSVFWSDGALQKRESWLYLSGSPTRVVFLNGVQQSQETVAGGAAGPKVDPSLFTPQTTQDQLTAAFGLPTSVTAIDGAPQFQVVSYGVGLTAVFLNGRFNSASSTTP